MSIVSTESSSLISFKKPDLELKMKSLQDEKITRVAFAAFCFVGMAAMAGLAMAGSLSSAVHWATLVPLSIGTVGGGYLCYANACKRKLLELETKLNKNDLSKEELVEMDESASELSNSIYFREREDEWAQRLSRIYGEIKRQQREHNWEILKSGLKNLSDETPLTTRLEMFKRARQLMNSPMRDREEVQAAYRQLAPNQDDLAIMLGPFDDVEVRSIFDTQEEREDESNGMSPKGSNSMSSNGSGDISSSKITAETSNFSDI